MTIDARPAIIRSSSASVQSCATSATHSHSVQLSSRAKLPKLSQAVVPWAEHSLPPAAPVSEKQSRSQGDIGDRDQLYSDCETACVTARSDTAQLKEDSDIAYSETDSEEIANMDEMDMYEEAEFDTETQLRLDTQVDRLLKGYDWTLSPLANK